MIEPKTVVISRDNEIADGWRLLSPTSFSIAKNPLYTAPSLSSIRKSITYARSVLLRICEPCLPRSILDELKWVRAYAPITIEATSDEIIKRYGDIGFAKQTIVPSLEGNLIIIEGDVPKAFCIDDSFEEIDYGTINGDDPFRSAVKVYLFDQSLDILRDVKTRLKKNIPLVWVRKIQDYSKDILIAAKEEGVELLIAISARPAIVIETIEGAIFKLVSISDQQECLAPVESLNDYGYGLYSSAGFVDAVLDAKVPYGLRYCQEAEAKPLDLKPSIEIAKDVEIGSMDDFVMEQFDSSLVDGHNDFALDSKRVDYRFTLYPPKVAEEAVESTIYTPIRAGVRKWDEAQQIDFSGMKASIEAIYPDGGILLDLLNKVIVFSRRLKSMVSKCQYRGYYASLMDARNCLLTAEETILAGCKEIYSSIASANTDTRFLKLDAEIEGYRATIAEKMNLIDGGVEVLSNKHRIEVLNRKIEDLLKLKQRFIESVSSSESKNAQAFGSLCEGLLHGNVLETSSEKGESIGKVIGTGETSKETRLSEFVRQYLPGLLPYFSRCLSIVDELLSIRIPEENQVVDQNGKSFLVIDNIEEFEKTREIREELGLGCLARRQ